MRLADRRERLFPHLDHPTDTDAGEPLDPTVCAAVDALAAPEGWPLGNMGSGYRLAYRGKEMLLIQALPCRKEARIVVHGKGVDVVAHVRPEMLAETLAVLLQLFERMT